MLIMATFPQMNNNNKKSIKHLQQAIFKLRGLSYIIGFQNTHLVIQSDIICTCFIYTWVSRVCWSLFKGARGWLEAGEPGRQPISVQNRYLFNKIKNKDIFINLVLK